MPQLKVIIVGAGTGGLCLAHGLRAAGTLHPLLVSVVRYAVLLLVAIVALRQIGIETSSLLAVIGAAGLAVGLALQGTVK